MGDCNFGKILAIKIPKFHMGSSLFLIKKLWNSSGFCYVEPGRHSSITDFVEAMNTLIQERHNHSESCITVEVSRRTKKFRFTLQMKDLMWHSVKRTWDTFSASKVDNELGVLLGRKGPHKTQVAHKIVHIYSLMIYTNLIEYTIDGDTKARLLRCLPFFPNLKAGDIITAGP